MRGYFQIQWRLSVLKLQLPGAPDPLPLHAQGLQLPLLRQDQIRPGKSRTSQRSTICPIMLSNRSFFYQKLDVWGMHLPKLFDAFKQQVDLEGIVMNSMQMWASFHLSLLCIVFLPQKRYNCIFAAHCASRAAWHVVRGRVPGVPRGLLPTRRLRTQRPA